MSAICHLPMPAPPRACSPVSTPPLPVHAPLSISAHAAARTPARPWSVAHMRCGPAAPGTTRTPTMTRSGPGQRTTRTVRTPIRKTGRHGVSPQIVSKSCQRVCYPLRFLPEPLRRQSAHPLAARAPPLLSLPLRGRHDKRPGRVPAADWKPITNGTVRPWDDGNAQPQDCHRLPQR
jgi:hypothetical protein